MKQVNNRVISSNQREIVGIRFSSKNIYIYIFRIFIVIGIKRLIVYFFPEFIHQCLLLCIVSCDRVIWITNIDDWQFFTIHEYLFETVIINEALKITFALHIYVFFMRDERHDEIEWNRIKLRNLNFETSNIIKYYKQFFVISLFERSIVLYLDLYNPNPNFKLISLFLSESNFLNFIPYTCEFSSNFIERIRFKQIFITFFPFEQKQVL